MYKSLLLVFCVALTTSGLASALGANDRRPPNVILILADDLGWADLNCYGNRTYRTPNLDRLAAGGMRFTDAYAASSVCSPTRASIQSGKYPARLDLTIWLNGRSPAHAKLLDAPHATELPLEEVTIAESLGEAGYATASVGKWHLGGEPFFPQHQGYDLNVGGTAGGSPAGGYFLVNKMILPEAQQGEYLTDHLTDQGMRFIEANRRGPFFLYQSYHSVHTPIQGKPELVAEYEKRIEELDVEFNPAYAAMVHSLDENVGRIMDKLDELDIADDTVVVFFSDNGGYHRVTNNAPLRAGKGYSYEGGHREPLIVSYPRLIRPGSVCDEPVVSTDFYPTMLELADLKPKPQQHCDGRSIVPLLKDSDATLDREAIYWHYPHYSPQGGTPSGAIRQGPWKLIEFFEDGRLELYNLEDDLSEERDLAPDMPEKVGQLHEKLLAWREQVDAKMPSPNPDPNPGRRPSSTEQARGGPIDPTESFPGFAALHQVELTKSDLGYELFSNTSAFALMESKTPLRRADFELEIHPRLEGPNNGLLAFGDAAEEAKLVKCGIFVGGNYASIYEGPYPSADQVKLPITLEPGKPYDVTVSVDLDQQTVEMTVGDRRVSKSLSRKMDAIRFYGYEVIWTRTGFSPIEVSSR